MRLALIDLIGVVKVMLDALMTKQIDALYIAYNRICKHHDSKTSD